MDFSNTMLGGGGGLLLGGALGALNAKFKSILATDEEREKLDKKKLYGKNILGGALLGGALGGGKGLLFDYRDSKKHEVTPNPHRERPTLSPVIDELKKEIGRSDTAKMDAQQRSMAEQFFGDLVSGSKNLKIPEFRERAEAQAKKEGWLDYLNQMVEAQGL